jgi:hypothetical protein
MRRRDLLTALAAAVLAPVASAQTLPPELRIEWPQRLPRRVGVQQPGTGARFHLNGRFLGEVRDGQFTALFFGIWLAPWTSEPGLREALLGAVA